jgi:hypothetical protein
VVVLAIWLVVCVAPFVAGVLIPYDVNDLDAPPLAEVASGPHAPKNLWPQGIVGAVVQVAGFLSLSVTPIGLFIVGGLAGLAVVQEFGTLPKTRRPHVPSPWRCCSCPSPSSHCWSGPPHRWPRRWPPGVSTDAVHGARCGANGQPNRTAQKPAM